MTEEANYKEITDKSLDIISVMFAQQAQESKDKTEIIKAQINEHKAQMKAHWCEILLVVIMVATVAALYFLPNYQASNSATLVQNNGSDQSQVYENGGAAK